MSSLGDGDVLAGATGARFNEAIQGKLSKIQDPALHQWASVFVGVVAAKAVGGDAQTGGSTAASGTKNNDYAEGLDNPLTGLVVGGLVYLAHLLGSTPNFVVDPWGNAIPLNPGEKVEGRPDGNVWQVKDQYGNQTGDRYDGYGHVNQKDPKAQVPHGHRVDDEGNTVVDDAGNPHLPANSPSEE